jgi:RimJ/RimL family protein N-acetyltransferase
MIQLRNATNDDIDFYLAVRNDPKVYPGFYTQREPIPWQTHRVWWFSRNQDWRKYIIELDGKPIGILNIGQMDYWEFEIGIAILPDFWGKGYGKEAVRLAIEYGSKTHKYCRTTILDTNKQSIALFTSLGFKRMCEARPGESLYRKGL